MDASNGKQQASELLLKIYNNLDAKYKISKVYDYNSLEYFAASIFNIIFNCNLINLNEVVPNSPFIDLIDSEKSIGVQVTKQRPNTKKLNTSVNGFEKYGIKKIIVFFFNTSDAYKITPVKNEEIWTIPSISVYLSKNPEKCNEIIKVLKIWDNPSRSLPSDIISHLNKNTEEQIDKIVKHKKIDKDLLITDRDDEEKSLYFCGIDYGKFVFNSFKSLFYDSQLGKFLIEEDNEDKNSFRKLYSNNGYWNVSTNELNERKNKIFASYRESQENLEKQNYFQLANRSIQEILNKIISSNNAINSNLMSVVRPAGQGKTVFCCELSNHLINFGIPCIFITPMLHAGSLYDEFKNQVIRIGFNNTYNENLITILNYAKIWNLPLVVIIDALNEYQNTKVAINYIDEIVKDCKSAGYNAKIIISSRNKKYVEFKNNLNVLSNNIYTLNNHFYKNEEIKNKYFDKYNIKIKLNSSLKKLFGQSRLFIKVFCEIFNTKASYENFDILDLFDEYFEKKAQGDVEDNLFDDKQEVFDTINLITNWMLSNNLFDKAPLNCFEKTERSNIIKLVDGDIFNISNDGHDEYVGFVFEEFRDYFVSLSLKNKSCDELSYFFEDKMDMEGLLRNVILLRRKNKSNKKTDDSKFQWYRDGTAEVIQNLPLQSLDQIDKEIAVEKIESLSYTEMNDLKTINNLILLFLHTNLSNPLFRIECLVNLKGNGQENIKNFMSTEYLFVDLLNDLENSKCNCKYLKVLISMIVKMNISLPSNIKDRVKNILLVTFNVKKINELLLFGFGKDEINFFGEEKQYEIFKD